MIVIVARAECESAEQAEALCALAAPCSEATRQEPGCAEYTFARDVVTPNAVVLIELWDNEDALAAHMTTPHFGTYMAGFMGMNVPMRARAFENGQEFDIAQRMGALIARATS